METSPKLWQYLGCFDTLCVMKYFAMCKFSRTKSKRFQSKKEKDFREAWHSSFPVDQSHVNLYKSKAVDISPVLPKYWRMGWGRTRRWIWCLATERLLVTPQDINGTEKHPRKFCFAFTRINFGLSFRINYQHLLIMLASLFRPMSKCGAGWSRKVICWMAA